MRTSPSLYVAFTLSGVAGLVYEAIWSRYLGLYVGHSAYAQALVLAVYLGGMAVGALAVSDVSKKLANPLRGYLLAELILAGFGIAFHPLFGFMTRLSYEVVFPALGAASTVGAARWVLAGATILPQAMVLGATFPFMAAGLVRLDAARPGRAVARAYLLNTLGGAAGVLVAGFWLVGWVGLPGTLLAAAGLNVLAAGLTARATRIGPAGPTARATQPGAAHSAAIDGTGVDGMAPNGAAPDPAVGTAPAAGTAPSLASADAALASAESAHRAPAPAESARGAPASAAPAPDASAWAARPRALAWTLLVVSFGAAAASFAYEIGWIRMLSLVLGSATHAFELMLSAFILGLALGAWIIRDRIDTAERPLRLLGAIQVLMGIAALASIPLYALSFGAVGALVRGLTDLDGGYALFNVSRYVLCLAIMLPSTVLAGMSLPAITGSLLRAGLGEEAIGRVYGVNTVGSVFGATLAALVGLPALGVKGLLIGGAALDVVLGLWLLERSARSSGRGPRTLGLAAGLSVVAFAGIGFGVHLDELTVTSGVFRFGDLPQEGQRSLLYYRDGRTATVSAHLETSQGLVTLSTNGKPDASLGPRWRMEGRDTLPVTPIDAGRDFTTQVLAPLVALAHRPDAATVANIGHGSGMSGTTFLTSPAVERLVTIEIEPAMVEGSLVFLPANGPVFGDARSTFVFDDAKSYFAYRRERFDIIFAEPSNPWVSGTASLFTREFYEQVAGFLAQGGILAQWMQIYELNDRLFLSVLAALDAVFPSYRAYLVGDADVAIVASLDSTLAEPDWSVLEHDAVRRLTASAPPFHEEHMRSLLLFDDTTFRPLLDGDVAVNSDFHPLLDLGAERARFEQQAAEGTYSFGVGRFDLARLLRGERKPPTEYRTVPAYGLFPLVESGQAAWLRQAVREGGGTPPVSFPNWGDALVHLQTFLLLSRGDEQIGSWETWAVGFEKAESELHWGTIGWTDSTFYKAVFDFLDRADAPPEARAAVDLRHAVSLVDWPRAAAAADVLVPRVAAGERWSLPSVLLDAAVLAYLEMDRPAAARHAYEVLAPLTNRSVDNLRNRLLDALVRAAEQDAVTAGATDANATEAGAG